MIIYSELDANLETCASIQAKITKLDAIIDALFTTALRLVAKGDKIEYQIDTGQTKQRVVYASVDSVRLAISEYEKLRQMYVNKIIGNQYRNIDQRNLRRRNGY
jgi:hypothetical protein